MIWVRLIGGQANGQVVKVEEDQVEHVMRENVPDAASYRRVGIAPMSFQSRQFRYTRREVRGHGWNITFFADDNLSDHEALQSVLGP